MLLCSFAHSRDPAATSPFPLFPPVHPSFCPFSLANELLCAPCIPWFLLFSFRSLCYLLFKIGGFVSCEFSGRAQNDGDRPQLQRPAVAPALLRIAAGPNHCFRNRTHHRRQRLDRRF